MLDAIFKSYVECNENGCQIVRKEDDSFQIVAYAQFNLYTLVSWERDAGYQEAISGQTLWEGNVPIAITGGAFDLYQPEVITREDSRYSFQNSIRNLVSGTLGSYGLPQQAAMALANPENTVYLR